MLKNSKNYKIIWGNPKLYSIFSIANQKLLSSPEVVIPAEVQLL